MSALGPFLHEPPHYWKPNGWKLKTFQESSGSNFEEIFLNKIKPAKERIPRKRVKVDLKACVISHENEVKELKEKERKKERKEIKIDHPKRNQNLNMTRKILTKKKLKTSSYFMLKVMKNSPVKKMNYMRKRINKFLYAQDQLSLVSTPFRKCVSH